MIARTLISKFTIIIMKLSLKKSGDTLSLTIPQHLAKTWNLDENSIVELIETADGLMLRQASSPPSLDDLLASIPPDFTYPDDVADFITNEPIGNEQL